MPRVHFAGNQMNVTHVQAESTPSPPPLCAESFTFPEETSGGEPAGFVSLDGRYGWPLRYVYPFACLRDLTLQAVAARLNSADGLGTVACVIAREPTGSLNSWWATSVDDPQVLAVSTMPAGALLSGQPTLFTLPDPVVLPAGQYVCMWYDAAFLGLAEDHLEGTGLETTHHFSPDFGSWLTLFTDDASLTPVMVIGHRSWDREEGGYDNTYDLPIGYFCVAAHDLSLEVNHQVLPGGGTETMRDGETIAAGFRTVYAPVGVNALKVRAHTTGGEQTVFLRLQKEDPAGSNPIVMAFIEHTIPATSSPHPDVFAEIPLPGPAFFWQGTYSLYADVPDGTGPYVPVTDQPDLTGNVPLDFFTADAGCLNLTGTLLPKNIPNSTFLFPAETVEPNMLLDPPAVSTPTLQPLRYLPGGPLNVVEHQWEMLSEMSITAVRVEIDRQGPFLGAVRAILRADHLTEGPVPVDAYPDEMTLSSQEINGTGRLICTFIPQFYFAVSAGMRLTLTLQDAAVITTTVEGHPECYEVGMRSSVDPLGTQVTIPVYATGNEYWSGVGYDLLDPPFTPPATNLLPPYPKLRRHSARTITYTPASAQDVLDNKAAVEGQYIITAQNAFCTPKVTLDVHTESLRYTCERSIKTNDMQATMIEAAPDGDVILRAYVNSPKPMRLLLNKLSVFTSNTSEDPITLTYQLWVVPGNITTQAMIDEGWASEMWHVLDLQQDILPLNVGATMNPVPGDTLDTRVGPLIQGGSTVFLRLVGAPDTVRHHMSSESPEVPNRELLGVRFEGLYGYSLSNPESRVPHMHMTLAYHLPDFD